MVKKRIVVPVIALALLRKQSRKASRLSIVYFNGLIVFLIMIIVIVIVIINTILMQNVA